MGIEEGTCWDERWVLYGNQFDNKFHIFKKINNEYNKINNVLNWKKKENVSKCNFSWF